MERSKTLVLQAAACGILLFAMTACGGGGAEAPAPGQAHPAEPPPAAPAPAAAPSAATPAGSAAITGTVRYEGEVPPTKPLAMDADPGCAKKHSGPVPSELLVLGSGNTMANIFVKVKSGLPQETYPAPTEPVVIDQEGCRYHPHVLGAMVNQPVKILNSDGLLHNVHALPKTNAEFNQAMPATVTEAEHVFTKPEDMFKIKCDVHPWMGAWMAVLPHPYFNVTETDGQFRLGNLPAGTYEIEAWHEKLGTKTLSVTVADGETKTADFAFSR